MKQSRESGPENFFETNENFAPEVDDIYASQKNYFKTPEGQKALRKARKNYDKKNPEKRRKQKRDYMRRRREKEPDVWRD